jgi:hypothetical protein
MPTGPKGEKRPADVIGNAVKIMRIATGEEPEYYGEASTKNQAVAELGRCPAGILNQNRADSGIPDDSFSLEIA